ncbi:hypothetical protein R1flu_014065 [Riccia fluitans]|uniref:Uncharacterized protein n=1 Tax=Riccia fluitans TaxID=41844 RepID=A0ABD1YIH8_9MARC
MAGGWLKLIAGTIAAMLVATFYAAAGVYIQSVSDAPCSLSNERLWLSKEGIPDDLDYCRNIPIFMKVPLIATHLLAFALFPFAMYVFWVRAPQLKQLKARDPFSSILGFSFLMVSITGEIGWHVGQQWFYQEEYHVLNFVFYFFFMLGIACWANGIKSKRSNSAPPQMSCWETLVDGLLFISPLIVTLVYGASSTIKYNCPKPELCSGLEPTKLPIYILMAVEFLVLSIRLYKILDNDWRVVFVPIFSVIVNLVFIGLLNKNQDDIILNPLFHILHDLVGTELGVFIATLLVWTKTRPVDEESRKKSR